MKAQAGKTGVGSNRQSTHWSQKRNNAKGTSTTSHWRTAGQTDVKLGYGGEKYPTQKQVKNKAAKRVSAAKKGAEGPKRSVPKNRGK